MCDILRIAGTANSSIAPDDFRDTLNLMAHRGPDDSDVCFDSRVRLGHRRLLIVDLTPSGHHIYRLLSTELWMWQFLAGDQ